MNETVMGPGENPAPHHGANDVVFVVRPGDDNEELRHAIRSIHRHMPHRRIVLAGHRPPWATNVEHIPTPQTQDRFTNSTANLLAACDRTDLTAEVVYMNDDIFVLRDTPAVPVHHRGTVRALAADKWVTPDKRPATAVSRWWSGMIRTAHYLMALGVTDDPLSYELHTPMVIHRETMAEAIRKAQADRPDMVIHKRTLFGNIAAVGGTRTDDVKVFDAHHTWPDGARFVSTTDSVFAAGAVGRRLRAKFAEPSPYEGGV